MSGRGRHVDLDVFGDERLPGRLGKPGRVGQEDEDYSGKLGRPRHDAHALLRFAERAAKKQKAAAKRASKAGGQARATGTRGTPGTPGSMPASGGTSGGNLRGEVWALPDTHPAAGTRYGLGRLPRVVTKTRFHLNGRAPGGGGGGRGGRGGGGGGASRRGQPLREHLVYLARPEAQVRPDEAIAEGERSPEPPPGGIFFDARSAAIDAASLPQKWKRDRHHWRIIVSPQEGEALDLRAFTRDLARRLEAHFGTRLEWAAVVHVNTPHPHVHLLIRGLREDGRDLRMTRDDVAEHLRRLAAGELAARIGLKSEAEADAVLREMAVRKRPTELDDLLLVVAKQQGGGAADKPFKLPESWVPEACGRHHLRLRLETLEQLGLASREVRNRTRWGGVTRWTLRPGWQEKLAQLAAALPATQRPTKRKATKRKALPEPRPPGAKKGIVRGRGNRDGAEL